jgi:CRISPR type I-E-associated protein CasB/Cse2
MESKPDWQPLLAAWLALDNGPRAQMRRVAAPEDLLALPAFYRLVGPLGWTDAKTEWERRGWLRLVFCLSAGNPAFHVTSEPVSLGKALAVTGKINERRLFQLVRADWPQDMVQLRRLLAHVTPMLNWSSFAEQLWRWQPQQRQRLLEDFVISSPKKNA